MYEKCGLGCDCAEFSYKVVLFLIKTCMRIANLTVSGIGLHTRIWYC